MRRYDDVLSMIGNTPILKLDGFDTGPCELFIKLEFMNPGGSIKDRIAKVMIEDAEATGDLKPGMSVIEATAGNTGFGLALVCLQKGYPLTLVMPDKMSLEKVATLRAMGVEIIVTRSDVEKGHPEYYQDLALRLAKERDAFFINQFGNESNVKAHYQTTGPEIWEQMDGDIDAFVCGVGTGGTLTGVGTYLREKNPDVQLVLGDPNGSILADYINKGEMNEAGKWLVEGIGEDFIPSICDISLANCAYTVTDTEAFATVRKLLQTQGLSAGTSTGVLLEAALRFCQEQTEPLRVVTLIPDSGARYVSKVFNDDWLIDQGLVRRPEENNLLDLIAHRYDDHTTVVVGPDDLLNTALTRAKLHSISQLPVMKDDKLVGIIDEYDMLQGVYQDPEAFRMPVCQFMITDLQVVNVKSPIGELMPIFEQDKVAIVMEGEHFLGIITRIDLINYLRHRGEQAA